MNQINPSILDQLRQDYGRFPAAQSYHLYAEDVYFEDPLNRFRGRQRYQSMIRFMQTWFQDVKMVVHELAQEDQQITSRWTLEWRAPLPWRPKMAISGRSELLLDTAGKICSHIDYWDCSRWDVVKQLLPRRAD